MQLFENKCGAVHLYVYEFEYTRGVAELDFKWQRCIT